MRTPNDFWLQAHVLLEAYDAEGTTPSERAASVCDQLVRAPPVAQRELLAELDLLLARLADLYPAARAAVNERQEEAVRQTRSG